MNKKIYKLLEENLHTAFSLEKYYHVRMTLGPDTQVDELPWTPARYRKFKEIGRAHV